MIYSGIFRAALLFLQIPQKAILYILCDGKWMEECILSRNKMLLFSGIRCAIIYIITVTIFSVCTEFCSHTQTYWASFMFLPMHQAIQSSPIRFQPHWQFFTQSVFSFKIKTELSEAFYPLCRGTRTVMKIVLIEKF